MTNKNAALTPRQLADIKLAERERFQLMDAGLIDHPIFCDPAK